MGTFKNNPPKGPDGLTDLQRRFCEEYVKDYNGGQAYLRASTNCTKITSARQAAKELLKREPVKDYIKIMQKQLFEAKCVTYERLADELSKIAFDPDASKKDRMQAIALLQKQMGLDQVKVTADVNQKIEIKVGIEDGDKSETF